MDPSLEELAAQVAPGAGAAHDERLAVHAADGVLALLAGERTDEGRALRAYGRAHDPTALGTAACLAAVMRLTEIDDIHRPTAVTATAIALPAALALAPAAARSDPRRLLDALHAGQHVAVRLAQALGGARLLRQGVWPSYAVAPVGAAAAAARMLDLAPARVVHALALALAQVAGRPGRSQGARPGRWWLFGHAVRAGCAAALAAAGGVDGDPALLDADWLRRHGAPPESPAPAPAGAVIEEFSIKPHCSAKQVLAAVHAMRLLMADGLRAAAIEEIELAVPSAYSAMIDREQPAASRIASMVSARWQLALAALHPAALDDVERTAPPRDAALEALAARVRIVADPALDPLYPGQWPARLTVRAGGRRHVSQVADSPGDPALRFDAAQLLDKAARILGPGPDVQWVARMLALREDPFVLPDLYLRFASPFSGPPFPGPPPSNPPFSNSPLFNPPFPSPSPPEGRPSNEETSHAYR